MLKLRTLLELHVLIILIECIDFDCLEKNRMYENTSTPEIHSLFRKPMRYRKTCKPSLFYLVMVVVEVLMTVKGA